MLTVVKRSEAGAPTVRATGSVTGEMWRDVLQQKDGISVSKNFFTPCARTDWHRHEGGQMLIVESGEGFVGTEDEVVRMRVGDMVWTPPGVRHWHGGTHEHSLLHLAISFGGVDWQESVSDDQYQAAHASS